MTLSNEYKFLAAGNDAGSLFLINLDNKDKIAQIKPHYKIIRTLDFNEDSTKIITGSDD